jgi:hypothetical protein
MNITSLASDCRVDFLEARHRMVDGHFVDVADYVFRASRGSAHQVVKVGIEGLPEELSPGQLKTWPWLG